MKQTKKTEKQTKKHNDCFCFTVLAGLDFVSVRGTSDGEDIVRDATRINSPTLALVATADSLSD
jgi:hypothetical protein